MRCPRCNTQIKEGYLYCQECGHEIRMVPDYEVELDTIIDEGVSDVAQIVAGQDDEKKPGKEPEIPAETLAAVTQEIITQTGQEITWEIPSGGKNGNASADVRNKKEKKEKKETGFKLVVISVFGILTISLLLYAIIKFNQYFSHEYQYSTALSYYNIGNYADSLKTAKHALDLKKGDRNTSLLISDDYYALSKYDESNAILYNLLNQNSEDSEVYDRILENCIATGDYSAVEELIRLSPTDSIRNKFAAYMAAPPEFSDPSGEYEDDMEIWLTAKTPGTIYYTTDGSEPDGNSLIYSEPIKLSEGETVIKAFFVNEYGVESETVTGSYLIDYGFVTVPKLKLQSGSYTIPEAVEVEYPEEYRVYYTDNGADPVIPGEETETSDEGKKDNTRLYEKPILMPIGKTEYRFVSVDEKGRHSDVIVATYTTAMNCLVDQETAANAIKFQLMSRGEDVLDRSYRVKAAYGYSNSSFYVLYEYSGKGAETGRLFAVDTMTGSLFMVKYNDEKGKYTLSSI
ncbi:MAG: chitobiase/beta-hexosaminidase C-terminal domain-containing protein [Lachnospiraceae bacterium]|nr:chitobiase/beta-hexosaminidase C-terminal domain-containing protein [Lachnospiraceae bacterium]